MKATLWEEKARNSCSPASPGPHLATSLRSGEQPQSCRLWKGRWRPAGCKCKSLPPTRQRRKQSLGVMWDLRVMPTPWLSFPAGDLGSAQAWGERPARVCLGRWGGGRSGLPLHAYARGASTHRQLARTALSAKEQTLARRFHPRNPVRSQWACSKWDFILLLL